MTHCLGILRPLLIITCLFALLLEGVAPATRAAHNGSAFNSAVAFTTGAIGNFLWIDEDSDGQQDAGEPGISNAHIILKNTLGTVISTTWTNIDGLYIFPDLSPGSYFVDVDASTLPPGVSQTPLRLAGADYGNQDHSGNGYPVVIGGTHPLTNLTADFGYNFNTTLNVTDPSGSPTTTLGDRIWIDSDGDGALDHNELGVGGAQVTLYYDANNDGVYATPYTVGGYNPTRTTVATGYYIFDDLPPGAYKVCVTSSTDATHDILNTAQYTQTGDPDHFGQPAAASIPNQAHDNCSATPVVLPPGDVFLNVDFGYLPLPGVQLGSIGDTIWFDADTDGHGPALPPYHSTGGPITQGAAGSADAAEFGIVGVEVALIWDTNHDGMWEPLGADTLSQTPDDEPIIATAATDRAGQYVFSGLPLDDGSGSAHYIIWVQDALYVLQGLSPSYDADGLTTPNMSVRTLSPADPNPRDQDFGYTPDNRDPTLGLIGDTIWFDVNNSGDDQTSQGFEPGIQGVDIELLDTTNTVIATTQTSALGLYFFSNLPLNQTYRVRVASANFTAPHVLEGFYNTFDSNGGHDSLGPLVTLTAANRTVLDQDFSYVGSGSSGNQGVGQVGNLVWLDRDADGSHNGGLAGTPANLAAAVLPADEPPFANVIMLLYRDLNSDGLLNPGEPLLATAVTISTIDESQFDADGSYGFIGLPAGNYIVKVNDYYSVLNGYANAHGPHVGQDDNSQPQPYALHLDQGGRNLSADFGYYIAGTTAIGNWVWDDLNHDGIQNDGETGINGVRVRLTITYLDGTVTTLTTTTGFDPEGQAGWYTFGNLAADENFETASLRPTLELAVTTPVGYHPTLIEARSDTLHDSNDPSGTQVKALIGQTNTDRANDGAQTAAYDFGFVRGTRSFLPIVRR